MVQRITTLTHQGPPTSTKASGPARQRHSGRHAFMASAVNGCACQFQPSSRRMPTKSPILQPRTSIALSSSSRLQPSHSGWRAKAVSIDVMNSCTSRESRPASGGRLRKFFMNLWMEGSGRRRDGVALVCSPDVSGGSNSVVASVGGALLAGGVRRGVGCRRHGRRRRVDSSPRLVRGRDCTGAGPDQDQAHAVDCSLKCAWQVQALRLAGRDERSLPRLLSLVDAAHEVLGLFLVDGVDELLEAEL